MARHAASGDPLVRLDRRPIVVASHQRSGTHLTIDLIRKQCRECRSWKWPGEKLNRLYLSLEALIDPSARAPIDEAKALRVLRRVRRPLIKTHLVLPRWWSGEVEASGPVERRWIAWLRDGADLLYVCRDGRDVMCSLHYFRKGIDPTARCPLGEFIRQEVDGRSRARIWADHVRAWRGVPGVRLIKFEQVLHETRSVLDRLGGELGLTSRGAEPLLPRKFRGFLDSRLHRLFAFRSESSAILVWAPGHELERWREVLSPSDREFFDREAGDVLTELGYEASREWVREPPEDRPAGPRSS